MGVHTLKTNNNMDKNRLLWASRRGMLELDLILQPFVEQAFPSLDESDQRLYEQLLEEQDQDLFTWFLHRKDPDNPDLLRIVTLIREYTQARASHLN